MSTTPTTGGGILALYKYLDTFCDAIRSLRERGQIARYQLFSPTSYHEIEHACGYKPSPVRWYTLIGSLTGVSSGFGLALWTDYDWPLVVGGKTPGIYSLPAYVVIGFELAILLGAIATIVGMLVHCRLGNPHVRILDPRITDDHFAVYVPNVAVSGSEAKFLKEMGADEIRVV